jgi:hypothetical protein
VGPGCGCGCVGVGFGLWFAFRGWVFVVFGLFFVLRCRANVKARREVCLLASAGAVA